jgi:beta-ribofuranosylaminobenzene 5'-phosphate synthase
MLDLSGSLGRRFGGIGAAVPEPSLLVSAAIAPTLSVHTARTLSAESDAVEDARRATHAAAERMLVSFSGPGGIRHGARVTLHRLIPAHHGLGSGTQLALATARAIAELYDWPREASGLAQIVGRAKRSAIGTHVFELGGFVLEGGRDERHERPAPLLARLAIPAAWRCVLTLPTGQSGMSGETEIEAFATLPTPPVAEAERVAHRVLLALLPALVEDDCAAFGAALTEIQRVNGRWFASKQGGYFAPGPSAELVERLLGWGASGVGQSSWGPAVYAIAPDPDAGAALADRVRRALPAATVYEGPFSQTGARVWTDDS